MQRSPIARGLQKLLVSGWLIAIGGSSSCFDELSLSNARIRVFVHGGTGPIAGALVRVSQIDDSGYPLEDSGKPKGTIDTAPALAVGQTGDDGYVELAVGAYAGSLYVRATGGTVVPFEGSEDPLPPLPVPDDVSLRAIIPGFIPYQNTIQEITLSPFTTLAVAVGEGRMAGGDRIYTGTMIDAQKDLEKHLGEISFTAVYPVPGSREARVSAEDEQHILMMAAFAGLARRMEEESRLAEGQFGPLDLLRALLIDAWDGKGLLDGRDKNGNNLSVAACTRSPGCLSEPLADMCKTLCDLDGNTLRSEFAKTLIHDVLLAGKDLVSLTFHQVYALAQMMASNQTPWLFGSDAIEPIQQQEPVPVIEVELTSLSDESDDVVTFSADAVPIHEPSGARIELGMEGTCPTVYKHVHRLDENDSNPMRWRFTVRDQNGMGIAQDNRGQFRVRSYEGPDDEWTTEWMDAEPLASMEDGSVQYEVVITRSNTPLLGEVEGLYYIDFANVDSMQRQSQTVSRCWRSVLLASPVEVGETVEVFDHGSLHAVGLEPDRLPLAPLLNGLPVREGLGVMEFSVRNGTTEPVYLSLHYEQPMAVASKDWILTSALLHEVEDPSCLLQGLCPEDWPRHVLSVDPAPVNVAVPELIGGIRAWDVSTESGVPTELLPCEECGPNEFLIPGRVDPVNPRTIKLRAVVSHLGEIAPRAGGADGDEEVVYADVPIEREYLPIIITGERYEHNDVNRCMAQNNGICLIKNSYSHYRALTSASLVAGEIVVTGKTRANTSLPARMPTSHNGVFGLLDSFEWETAEQPLPTPEPQD